MSREEFELFMLEQQKKLSEQQEKLSEQQAKFREDMELIKEQTSQNTESIAKLVDVVMSLTNVVQSHEDRFIRLEEKMEEWAEQGKATDVRLDALINLFERHIKEGHNQINDPGVGQ